MDDAQDERYFDGCGCHVCNTLRKVLGANVEADHDARVRTPLLLTYAETAQLLGASEDAVRSLVKEGELRAVSVQTYSRRRIPRVEIDEYIGRLLTGQLRAWVEARRDLDQWGLRYMGDRRSYNYSGGRKMTRVVGWHLGDGKTPLCGKTPVGIWEVTTHHWAITRLCDDCEEVRQRRRLEKLEGQRRPPLKPAVIRPMLTVVSSSDGGETVRRAGWHLGDGKTTLCGITRDRWALPDRRPRVRACAVCQKVAGFGQPDKTRIGRVDGYGLATEGVEPRGFKSD